ncbi:MAG TPA: gamma-glutamyl-gamma-aminobutyrate hydrolase family protein, partial [Candidatus Erysipelatoclostridium merdavium]|nr:gamma-glutamyl-gamma-aminobutyrate hydrolase family protein [Candidatus Erysipelatoclostridium merdavium]
LSNQNINQVYEDSRGLLWIATREGLNVYDSKRDELYEVPIKPGFSKLLILGITEDEKLKNADGMIVPGGFGNRGIEGMIIAIEYARVNKLPFFGICLGMQLATIEFARNVCGLKDANSIEFDEICKTPIITLMSDQSLMDMGGTQRLGNYRCELTKGTKAHKLYGKEIIEERHRHRYEFNNEYRQVLIDNGLIISGVNPERNLVEIIEIEEHPYFVACQFHPEFTSRPNRSQPLFQGLITAAHKRKYEQ